MDSEELNNNLIERALAKMRLEILKQNPNASITELNKLMQAKATEEISNMWQPDYGHY